MPQVDTQWLTTWAIVVFVAVSVISYYELRDPACSYHDPERARVPAISKHGFERTEYSAFPTSHHGRTARQQQGQPSELDASTVGQGVSSQEDTGEDGPAYISSETSSGDADSGKWCHPTKPSEPEGLGFTAEEFQSAGKVGCIEPMDIHHRENLLHMLQARSFRREIIMLVTDTSQSDMALNLVMNLRSLGIEHYFLVTMKESDDGAALCNSLRDLVPDLGCVWTSFRITPHGHTDFEAPPSKSYYLWSMRKHYLTVIAGLTYNVFQSDTDVVWLRNPYPVLKKLLGARHLLLQVEVGHVVNGGVLYVQNAHPQGPVVRALEEMSRRIGERATHPREILMNHTPVRYRATMAKYLAKLYKDRKGFSAKVSLASHTSDEQDLLNDVVFGACNNAEEHFHAFKAQIMQSIRMEWPVPEDREKEAIRYVDTHQPRNVWSVDDTYKLRKDLVPSFMCQLPEKHTWVEYCNMSIPGRYVVDGPAVIETASRVPQWVFGAHRTTLDYALTHCSLEGEPRATWQMPPSRAQTHVWHTVGAPGNRNSRQLLMRFFGAWHYYPVDHLHLPQNERQFPLDSTRVLALAPTVPASGLAFNDSQQVLTLLRRLGMLAASTGRVPVHPLLDCTNFFKQTNRIEEGFLQAPCPNANRTCCVSIPNCNRNHMCYPPELSFLIQFLPPDRIATVEVKQFYRRHHEGHSATASLSGAQLGTRSWLADTWREATETVKHVYGSANFGHVKQHLQLHDKQVVFIDLPGLKAGIGHEVLGGLPSSLWNMNNVTINEVGGLNCDGIFTPMNMDRRYSVKFAKGATSKALDRIKAGMPLTKPSHFLL